MFKKSTVPLGLLTLLGSFLLLGLLGVFLDCLFPVTVRPYLDIKYLKDGSAMYEEYDQNSSAYSTYDPQGHFIEKVMTRNETSLGQVRMWYMNLSYRREGRMCGPGSAVFPIDVGQQQGECWYLLTAEGLMEGYSRATRRLIGYMTPEGFDSEKPAARSRFADIKTWVEWGGFVWLLNGRALFVIDTDLHTIRNLAALPEDTQWLCVCGGRVRLEADGTAAFQDQSVFAIAGKRLLKLTMKGEILWAVPLPKETMFEGQDETTIYRKVGIIDNGGTILAAVCNGDKSRQNHIVVLDAKGNLAKSYSPPLSPPWWKEPQEDAVRRWLEIAGLESTVGPWVMFADWSSVRLGLYISLVYAVLCACIIGFDARGRRLSRRARIFWIVFGLLFSLPGLAVYFVVGPRAPMTACPSCGAKRPIDVVECPRCKAAFPKPAPTGLEIFDKT